VSDIGPPSAIRKVELAASLRDEVEAMLSSAIVSGELAPGTLVSVPALAAQFRVSATPVREAMLDLQKRGFVEPVRNKGFRVTEVGERDIREIVTLRCWLEVPAMRDIARRFPRDRIEEFRAMAEATVRAVDRGELGAYIAADVDFHLNLLGVLGNKRLIDEVASLRQQTRMVGLAEMVGTSELRRSATEHHHILDLLMDGDEAGIQALMISHIAHVIEWWNHIPDARLPRPIDTEVAGKVAELANAGSVDDAR